MEKIEKDKILIQIGERISEIRINKNMSLQDVSDICNFEKPNLVRIEKGRINFTIGTLVKIANALDIELKDLIH